MFRWPALFIVLISALPVSGQRVIRGQVLNTSGQPLFNCNVFINGSTKGTVTGEAGNFMIVDPPAGKHELIISSVGYETYVIAYTEEELPLMVRAELKIRVRELDNVVLEPFTEGTWTEWGNKFLENFIGTSANSLKCHIRNTDSIHFRYYKKSNRLVAYADVPLLIDNEALGYHISYQLEAFELNFRSSALFYAGYPQVVELEPPRKGVESRWSRQRQKAYEGSVIHFMRSLYENRLAEEGFEVHRMQKIPNEEKARVKRIWSAAVQTLSNDGRIVAGMPVKGIFPKDSQAYYQRILMQDDLLEVFGPVIMSADSLLENKKGSERILFFPDYLYVVFKKETEEDAFLRSQFLRRRPSWQLSYLGLLNGNAIGVESNGGYFDPRDILTMGYWGWSEKIADYMPVDYEPPPAEKK